MNFDTSVSANSAVSNLGRFDVGNVYRDDAEKLHSDLIGINSISLEDVEDAMDLVSTSNSGKNANSQDIFLKNQVRSRTFFKKFDNETIQLLVSMFLQYRIFFLS